MRYDDVSRLRKQIKTLYRRLQREFSGVDGLTITTFQMLRVVERSPQPVSPSFLAEELEMTHSNVAAALRTLETKLLVVRRRDPSDGRRAFIEITALGSKLVMKARGTPSAWLKNTMEVALSEDEQRQLLKAGGLMERLATYITVAPETSRPRRKGQKSTASKNRSRA